MTKKERNKSPEANQICWERKRAEVYTVAKFGKGGKGKGQKDEGGEWESWGVCEGRGTSKLQVNPLGRANTHLSGERDTLLISRHK